MLAPMLATSPISASDRYELRIGVPDSAKLATAVIHPHGHFPLTQRDPSDDIPTTKSLTPSLLHYLLHVNAFAAGSMQHLKR